MIAAVGDIACQSFSQSDGEGACRSDEVAALVTEIAPDRFFALGDLQYNNGKLEEFLRVYDQQFGHLNPITMPTPGNHEYGTEGAQGYFDYFGAAAHGPEGYYSFDLGAWHVVSLNSDICRDDPGCGPGTPQYDWLAADLAGNDAMCTLAFQHHPVFDWRPWQKFVDPDDPRPNGGSENEMYLDLWRLLDGEGVDVMLNGHNHIYHRWAPQHADGQRAARWDPAVHGRHGRTVAVLAREEATAREPSRGAEQGVRRVADDAARRQLRLRLGRAAHRSGLPGQWVGRLPVTRALPLRVAFP